jgi:hypothetical protein
MRIVWIMVAIIVVVGIAAIWYISSEVGRSIKDYYFGNKSQQVNLPVENTITLKVGQKYKNGDLTIVMDSIKVPTSSVPGNRPTYSLDFWVNDLNFKEEWDPMFWNTDHPFSFAGYSITTKSFDSTTLTLQVDKSPAVRTTTFSCPSMKGFTFDYPLYDGLDKPYVMEVSPQECIIILSGAPKGVGKNTLFPSDAPQIQVQALITDGVFLPPPGAQKNINGVSYWELSGLDGYLFNGYIKISTWNITGLALTDFNRDVFWKTVIDSFKFQ